MSASRHISVTGPENAGQTLGAVVRRVTDLPWTRARELCRRGKVRVNEQLETDAARRLTAGDQVTIDPAAPRLRAHVLEASALVHVERELVVVNKPAGVMTMPFEDGDKNTLVDRVRFALRRQRDLAGRHAELGVVQRLDKDTTGLLVFSRTLAAKRHLQNQLREHSIERRYLAIVHGTLTTPCTIESELVLDRGDGLRGSFKPSRQRPRPPPDAQHAVTHVRPLRALRNATLVECQLETGRQHQIRIHLSERGHMLVGEQVYVREHRGPRLPAPRPMLHAYVLGFTHPQTERPMRFELDPPEDFAHMLLSLVR
jgi:23S rRNA pseudouridine1911/1915/1917 synthase